MNGLAFALLFPFDKEGNFYAPDNGRRYVLPIGGFRMEQIPKYVASATSRMPTWISEGQTSFELEVLKKTPEDEIPGPGGYWAIIVERGGVRYRFLGYLREVENELRFGKCFLHFAGVGERSIKFWRRWTAGFRPWEEGFMEGEANKLWETVAEIERRSDDMSVAMRASAKAQEEILSLLREKKAQEATLAVEHRRLHSLPMTSTSFPSGRERVVDIAQEGVVYHAWDSRRSAYVEVAVAAILPEEDDEEDDDE